MTVTPAKLEANRRNAQHSSGPKTPPGKAASSRNALRHGLSAGVLTVLPSEDQADLDQLIADITGEFKPVTKAEQFLVDQMIHARWRLARVRRLEAQALDRITEDVPDSDSALLDALDQPGSLLDKLARYAAAADRAWSKAVRELAQLRANAQKLAKQNEAKEGEAWLYAELARIQNEPIMAPSASPEQEYQDSWPNISTSDVPEILEFAASASAGFAGLHPVASADR